MGGRLHYYVLICSHSPVIERYDVTMHPVPDEHMDTCATGRIPAYAKITINFPDWHSHGSLMTACDTMCHPVTPFWCPDGADFGYSRRYKDDEERIFSDGREYITIFRMKNSCSSEHGKLCFGAPEIISGTPKQLAARLKAREGLHSEVVAPESGKTGAKNKNKPLLYTDRLSRNGHRRKRE